MIPYICSHTRTGTHLLAAALHRNFKLPFTDYESLHYSHSVAPSIPFVHLYRPLAGCMRSIYMCREHLGIAGEVTFAQMLRSPWPNMPKSTICQHTYFNGELCNKVCPPRWFEDTLPERWLRLSKLFAEKAKLSVSYYSTLTQPERVLNATCAVFELEPSCTFTPVLGRVGWWQDPSEEPCISKADNTLLEDYQCRFDSLSFGIL
jgi:hypothetical protein